MIRETALLMGGLVGVLSSASAVAAILSFRAGETLSPALQNLNQRIKAWWLMVLLISGAFICGKAGVIVLFAFVSFAALREYVTLTYSRRSDHRVLLGMFGIVIPVQYLLVWCEWYGCFRSSSRSTAFW